MDVNEATHDDTSPVCPIGTEAQVHLKQSSCKEHYLLSIPFPTRFFQLVLTAIDASKLDTLPAA